MKKLKLNRLSDNELAKKQMNDVKGGAAPGGGSCSCCCGCKYKDQGGSSTEDNSKANGNINYASGLYCSGASPVGS
jgi:natural product precursor